jgi:hypothetical protein
VIGWCHPSGQIIGALVKISDGWVGGAVLSKLDYGLVYLDSHSVDLDTRPYGAALLDKSSTAGPCPI